MPVSVTSTSTSPPERRARAIALVTGGMTVSLILGVPRRFDRAALTEMLTRAGFTTLEARGVRLFSDLVPSAFVDSDAERAALLELEELASADDGRTGLGGLGAAVHLVARRD